MQLVVLVTAELTSQVLKEHLQRQHILCAVADVQPGDESNIPWAGPLGRTKGTLWWQDGPQQFTIVHILRG